MVKKCPPGFNSVSTRPVWIEKTTRDHFLGDRVELRSNNVKSGPADAGPSSWLRMVKKWPTCMDRKDHQGPLFLNLEAEEPPMGFPVSVPVYCVTKGKVASIGHRGQKVAPKVQFGQCWTRMDLEGHRRPFLTERVNLVPHERRFSSSLVT
jgi:hypothetical protein